MTTNRLRLAIGACLLSLTPLVMAAPATTPATATTTAATTAAPARIDDYDSRETRDKFRELLHTYPPAVAMVLKLDPSLFNNTAYLASYPGLAAFVAVHPEIAHAPDFYLQTVAVSYPTDTRQDVQHERTLRILAGLAGIFVFLTVTLTLAWLVKTLIQQRRWNRQSHVQTEVHSKLMERLTTGEEMIAYAQSPAGKRFLEGGPIALDAAAQPVSVPISRFLWSMQAGLVLSAAGFGMEIVSGQMPIDVTPVASGLGILILSIGIGFVVSAIVSFVLSRKLGLVPTNPPASDAA
jgi:small-conductance mechanosensitive channel